MLYEVITVRQQEVDAVKEKLSSEGADRFEIQEALMPFREQLPKKYRGRNERLHERI